MTVRNAAGRGFVFAAAIFLAACGGSAADKNTAGESTAVSSAAVQSGVEETDSSALGDMTIAFSLGERSISSGAAIYSLLQQKAYYETVSENYYSKQMTAEDWQEIQTDGNTLAWDLTQGVWDSLCDYLAAADYADRNQIALSDQEREETDRAAREEYASITASDLEISGLSEEEWVQEKEIEALYAKVQKTLMDSYSREISDEEARTMTYYVIAVSLDGTEGVDGLPTREEAESRLSEIFARADAGENIASTAEEYGYSGMEDALSVGVYPEDADAARALSLAAGESMTFLSDEHTLCGIYCLNPMDEERTAQRKEEMKAEAKDEYFRNQLDEWKKNADIKKYMEQDEKTLAEIHIFD